MDEHDDELTGDLPARLLPAELEVIRADVADAERAAAIARRRVWWAVLLTAPILPAILVIPFLMVLGGLTGLIASGIGLVMWAPAMIVVRRRWRRYIEAVDAMDLRRHDLWVATGEEPPEWREALHLRWDEIAPDEDPPA